MASDESIIQIDGLRAKSKWRLHASSVKTGNKINRSGEEIITFYNNGLIKHVDVLHHPILNDPT
jgi:hypothetical protein